ASSTMTIARCATLSSKVGTHPSNCTLGQRVAIAYRLLFAYALIRSESEQNSSHSLSRVGFAAIALAATRAARHITGRGPPRDVARREPETAASLGLPRGPARLGVPRR